MVYDAAGHLLCKWTRFVQRTNSGKAEFEAVAAAIRTARRLRPGGRVRICSDDGYSVGLLSGSLRIRERHRQDFRRLRSLRKGLQITAVKIDRSENKVAHRLCRETVFLHLKAQVERQESVAV